MQSSNRAAIEFAGAVVLAVITMAMIVNDARGQATQPEAPHPAFGPVHTSQLTVESEIEDTPAGRKRLEDKAIAILRVTGTVTGERMTLAEARAVTRVDGQVNVARCKEIVITNALRSIAQMRVTGVRVGNGHPVVDAGGAQ